MKHVYLFTLAIFAAYCTYAQEDVSFFENFDDGSLQNFRYGSTGKKSDFKWKSGAVSSVDKALKVLSFKIDPADSAGA